MKKILLFLIVFVTCVAASAQDVIVKKDGSTVLCKIIQVNGNEVIYLKWSDLNGPQYIMDSSLVSIINYEDGRQDKLNEQTFNKYAPGIQQNGDAEYNDNALLALDKSRFDIKSEYLKKAKKLKIIGWCVGTGGTLLGAGLFGFGFVFQTDWALKTIGSVLMAGSLTTGIVCLVKSTQYNNKVRMLSSVPIFQHDIKIKDKTTFSAGIDIIRDNQTHNFLPGLGLLFNF